MYNIIGKFDFSDIYCYINDGPTGISFPSFKYVVNNDLIKYNICKENNYKILYFIYEVKNINKGKVLSDYNPNNIYNKDNLFEDTEELYNSIIK